MASFFNGSFALPIGNNITFNTLNGNNIILTSNDNTISNYSLVLPSQIGSIGQTLSLSNIIGNVGYIEFGVNYTG